MPHTNDISILIEQTTFQLKSSWQLVSTDAYGF